MDTLSQLDAAPCVTTHTDLDQVSAVTGATQAGGSAPLGRSVVFTFRVPAADHAFFSTAIPEEEQRSIKRWLKICETIFNAKARGINIHASCYRLEAELTQNGQIKTRGFAWRSIRLKYYDYTRGCTRGDCTYAPGDWRALWNRAKAPPARTPTMSRAFIDFVVTLYDQNQRKFRPAWEELLHIWRTHYSRTGKRYDAIPGYAAWPAEDPFTGIPAGWSYQSLQKRISNLVDDFARDLATIGQAAASQHRLKVYTSRTTLRLLEYIEFDDHEFNLKVNFPGQRKAMRPRGFAAMDVLSACAFAHVFKTTLWDEDEEKKKTLTERDFMWFTVRVLNTIGYRADDRGTALVTEWGTAAIRDWFETRIDEVTHGKVRVERSGKFGKAAHDGAFEGRSKGNFRFKALIESFFNPLDNILASLPGQVGKDRDHSPEQLHGAERYNNLLLVLKEQLPEHSAALVKTPFLTFAEFAQNAVYLIDHCLNGRTRHALEGWEKLNFIAKEWRLGPGDTFKPYEQLLALPDDQRQLAVALIDAQRDLLLNTRRMSPREVWTGLHTRETEAGHIVRVPYFQLPQLVGPEHAYRPPGKEVVTVRNGIFEIKDQDFGPDITRFKAVTMDGQRLNNGTEAIAYINPLDPASPLVACDSKGRVLGVCPRIELAGRNDADAIKRAMGEAKAWEAEAMAPFRARHQQAARDKAAMHAHNAEIFSGTTPAQRAANQRAAEADADRVEAARDHMQTQIARDAEIARDLLNQDDL